MRGYCLVLGEIMQLKNEMCLLWGYGREERRRLKENIKDVIKFLSSTFYFDIIFHK